MVTAKLCTSKDSVSSVCYILFLRYSCLRLPRPLPALSLPFVFILFASRASPLSLKNRTSTVCAALSDIRATMSYYNTQKRSSGLDFSDGKVPALEQHPDMNNIALGGNQPSHLQRNMTERRRLQGLQRSNTSNAYNKVEPYKPRTLREKWALWMINEGGRRMFFFVWCFLHVLVFVLGTLHYQLKDNLVTARATFGVTFSTSLIKHFEASYSQLPPL